MDEQVEELATIAGIFKASGLDEDAQLALSKAHDKMLDNMGL